MSWLWSVPALLLPSCAAYRLVLAAADGMRSDRAPQALRACLAVGIGLGISSCTWFLWLVLFGTPQAMYRIADAAFWLLIIFICRPAPEAPPPREETCTSAPRRRSPIVLAVACLFALVLASAAAGFVGETRARPDGGWDAWAIWNLRAKFLAGGDGDWREALSERFDHGDYPLLVPATLARWQTFADSRWASLRSTHPTADFSPLPPPIDNVSPLPPGEGPGVRGAAKDRSSAAMQAAAGDVETRWASLRSTHPTDLEARPALLAFAFTALTIALCTLAVAGRRAWSAGLLAGIVLLGTVRLVRWGAAQYADVPLAFFFLATATLFVWHDGRETAGRKRGLGLLLLAGLTTGLCAWTKNEGLLFAAIVIVLRPLIVWFRQGQNQATREGFALFAGAAPVLAVVLVFKLQVPIANDLIAGQQAEALLPRLLDPVRHVMILKSLTASFMQVAHGFVVVLPICVLLLGRRRGGARDALFPAAIGILMLAGYYATYLVTPHDLAWHLASSVDRLIVQLWPTLVAAMFLSMRSPEEALAQEAQAVLRIPFESAPAVPRERRRAA
jgi:hypothetical protein